MPAKKPTMGCDASAIVSLPSLYGDAIHSWNGDKNENTSEITDCATHDLGALPSFFLNHVCIDIHI